MAYTVWDGDEEVAVDTVTVWDGTAEVAADAYMMPLGYNGAASMINEFDTFYIAHRGGSDDWPEMSMKAYTNATAWGVGAMEVSANRTSDGVWVGVHDANLVRTSPSAPPTPVAEMTWAQVQQYQNTLNGGAPYARLEDILDAYGSTHVMFLDPKYGGWDMDGFCSLILDHIPAANVVIKFFYTASDVADAAHSYGLLTFGYYYQDSASEIPNSNGPWDVLGMDYTADQAAWNLALDTGKKVVAHVVPTAATAATAISKGASGLIVSGIIATIPGPVVPIGS